MTEFTARNGVERFVFEGVMLASTTTERKDSSRWTEVKLFRTEGGKYVLEKVGRTLVYHRLDGFNIHKGRADYGVVTDAELLDDEALPCPECLPPWDPTDPVKMETDRYFAIFTETASALVDACRVTDNDPESDGHGTVFIPNVARRALVKAAERDAGIEAAYLTQRIA